MEDIVSDNFYQVMAKKYMQLFIQIKKILKNMHNSFK